MIQVKICGITSLQDALCAGQNGAAAVGFIFYLPSPRSIQPAKARVIIDQLPDDLVKVGVFVNEDAHEVRRISEYCRLDMIQLHGDETPEYCRQFPRERVIKALTVAGDEDVGKASDYDVAAILADTRHAGLYGGTGRTGNWDVARKIAQPLVLAGGLKEANIQDALGQVHPAALDINSGVEESPGKKDPSKVARMMQVIRAGDPGGSTTIIFTQREKK